MHVGKNRVSTETLNLFWQVPSRNKKQGYILRRRSKRSLSWSVSFVPPSSHEGSKDGVLDLMVELLQIPSLA
uniref:Uncharacterized protein n=2 Tax=Agrobacterium TaxID=357 RepID=A0A2Z2PI84_9HYPH|nr:hypothetical protein [Agrobacterium fabrum]ASK49585.1 5-oxoprolinase [Agrobacterium larrymoorei]